MWVAAAAPPHTPQSRPFRSRLPAAVCRHLHPLQPSLAADLNRLFQFQIKFTLLCFGGLSFSLWVALLVAMAGLAQTMMSCTAVRGNASSFMGSALASSVVTPGKSARMVAVPRISAVKTPEECNEEECAPVKEVGKLSMDWKTEDNNKVTGTYPPMARTERKWTGYVEKDTAGQTNIYAVEPTIYVAESAISTGAAGGAANGTEESLAVVGGLALIAVASAVSILLTVGKNAPAATSYVGPPLSYYVSKFSQETASPPAFSAQIPPIPESPPLSEDMSLAKPEVAVTEPVAAVSEAVSEAVSTVSSATQ